MDSSSSSSGTVYKFILAARSGELKRLKKLGDKLERGEGNYPKLREYPGYIALHVAAGEGHTVICEYLISKLKFDINFQSRDGEFVLPGHRLYKCASYLVENGDTPLHYAIGKRHQNTAKFLIENGASMDISNNQGFTPLHFAASYGGGKDLLQLCLSKGADIEADSTGGTPLTCAAAAADPEAVECLLLNKANIYPVNAYSIPIMAASYTSLACTQLLVKEGADINIDYCGETPLQTAAASGTVEVIEYLLKEGANPNVVSYLGLTPLEMAGAISKKEEAVSVLLPVTTRLSWIQDWTVQGVMKYVNSSETSEKILACRKEHVREAKSNGAEAFKKGEYELAVHWYTRALRADQLDATISCNKSLCFARTNNLRCALFTAKECVRLSPNWAKAHYRVGEALMLMKKYKEAAKSFARALQLSPNNSDILNAFSTATTAELFEMVGAGPEFFEMPGVAESFVIGRRSST